MMFFAASSLSWLICAGKYVMFSILQRSPLCLPYFPDYKVWFLLCICNSRVLLFCMIYNNSLRHNKNEKYFGTGLFAVIVFTEADFSGTIEIPCIASSSRRRSRLYRQIFMQHFSQQRLIAIRKALLYHRKRCGERRLFIERTP
jgi:hypothetical protein